MISCDSLIQGHEQTCRCMWMCAGVRGSVKVYVGMPGCVRDEFSEYLLENRVLTSADFNTYPIRIFLYSYITANYFPIIEYL